MLFRKTKFSQHPGPRAQNIHPAGRGDSYAYTVDKFRIVERIDDDGELVLLTRKGHRQQVAPDDLRIRRPSFWERRKYRSRFQMIPGPVASK